MAYCTCKKNKLKTVPEPTTQSAPLHVSLIKNCNPARLLQDQHVTDSVNIAHTPNPISFHQSAISEYKSFIPCQWSPQFHPIIHFFPNTLHVLQLAPHPSKAWHVHLHITAMPLKGHCHRPRPHRPRATSVVQNVQICNIRWLSTPPNTPSHLHINPLPPTICY